MDNKAFTLIETITTIVVFSIAILAISAFILHFYRTSSYDLNQTYALNSARKGMETIIKEIREMTYSDTGAYPIEEAENQSLSFYSDIDRDSNIEKVRYFLEGNVLKKGVIKSTGFPPQYLSENEKISVLSPYVRNGESESIFIYYDENNNELSDLQRYTEIKMIKIILIINVQPNRPPNEFTIQSNITLRNL